MRITIVSRIFAPEPGAATQRLGALTRALVAGGAAVRVLTTRAPGARSATSRSQNPRISRWPVLRDRSGYVRGYLPYLSFDLPAFLRLALCAPLTRRPADAVIVEPPPTTGAAVRLACAVRRVPYVYYAADVWSLASASTGAPGVVVRVVRALEAFALRGAAAVVAVSDGVAAEVRRLAPHAAVTVVGHGVDESVYHAGVAPAEPEVDAVYVGTASEWHGAMVFIEALVTLARRGVRPRVSFIGQGVDWERMRARIAEAGLDDSVSFAGPVDAATAARRVRGARAALASVKPGIGYDFAVPTKMYSALAVGTPVVFAGPEALRALVRDERLGEEAGDDADAVSTAIERAVAAEPSPETRARLAEWARVTVGADAVAQRVIAVVREVASRTRRARGRRAPRD